MRHEERSGASTASGAGRVLSAGVMLFTKRNEVLGGVMLSHRGGRKVKYKKSALWACLVYKQSDKGKNDEIQEF
jgi:hypothetical protein